MERPKNNKNKTMLSPAGTKGKRTHTNGSTHSIRSVEDSVNSACEWHRHDDDEDRCCSITHDVLTELRIHEKSLFTTQRGNIPIIITAPHGGLGYIPCVDKIRTQGVTIRDTHTAELALELSAFLERKLNASDSPLRNYILRNMEQHHNNHLTHHHQYRHKPHQQEGQDIYKDMAMKVENILVGMKDTSRITQVEEGVLLEAVDMLRHIDDKDSAGCNYSHKNSRKRLRPYVVIANFQRRYCDLNRTRERALEDINAIPYYKAYHAIIRKYIEDIQRFAAPATGLGAMLLDIHGQGLEKDTIFRGTKNGKTFSKTVSTHGTRALDGVDSILGYMERHHGYKVFPPTVTLDQASSHVVNEHPNFNGGYTVKTYGSHTEDGIDAIQLEYGANLRTNMQQRPLTAEHTADAVLHCYTHFYVDAHNNNDSTGNTNGTHQ